MDRFSTVADRLPGISPTGSIPAITTIGYTGLLAGPALLGFIDQHFSLNIAFGFLALLLVLVTLSYGVEGKVN